MDQLEALVRLLHLPGWGPVRLHRLIQLTGCPIQAFNADTAQIAALPQIPRSLIDAWPLRHQDSRWLEDLRLVDKTKTQLIPFNDPAYPKRLLDIPDPPILLYVRGKLIAPDHHGIAIVGTREATPYGMESAARFSERLAASGITIVSGLARGIDTVAHKSALRHGRTLAIIGSGLACLYPPENRGLAEQIQQNGAVISELPMATPPDKQTFPQRNRIVSGLSRGLLLIEAPEKSGAMITMELAAKHKKKCWTIPGRIDFPSFSGNHLLLKNRAAEFVTCPSEIGEALGDLFCQNKPVAPPLPSLTEEESRFLSTLPPGEWGVDEISRQTKQPVSKIGVLLMSLLIKKVIREHPGKRYQKRY